MLVSIIFKVSCGTFMHKKIEKSPLSAIDSGRLAYGLSLHRGVNLIFDVSATYKRHGNGGVEGIGLLVETP